MSLRTSQPRRTARFDWADGTTRVSVSFVGKGPAKATVAVAHERLPDADEALNGEGLVAAAAGQPQVHPRGRRHSATGWRRLSHAAGVNARATDSSPGLARSDAWDEPIGSEPMSQQCLY